MNEERNISMILLKWEYGMIQFVSVSQWKFE